MKTFQREVQLRTAGGLTVTDITDDVRDAVRESGIQAGICCVYSPHTTCSVRINEWERGFLEDFAVMLKRLIPADTTTRTTTGTAAPRTSAPRTWRSGTGMPTACRCSSASAGESIPW